MNCIYLYQIRFGVGFMRIGLNAKYAFDEKVRGIGKYTLKLIKNLSKFDHKNTYILYVNDIYSNEQFANSLPDNYELKKLNSSNYFIYEQILLPYYIKKDEIDLFHAPGNTFPIFTNSKLITTIHDVMFLKSEDIIPEPQSLYQKLGKYYRKINLNWINKNERIITVSNYSKKDINEETNFELSNIEVTHLGHDKDFLEFNIEENKALKIKDKLNISDRFIYHLGGDASNKNTEQVIKVYSKLPSYIIKKYQLVITGIKHNRGKWYKKIEKYGLDKERVIFTGYISDEELKFLYNEATLFIFLSIYEGFGIPILEAMSSKTPIIASNRTVIPEIVGDGGIIVDPDNIDEVKDKIIKILNSKKLQKNLIRRGLKNLERFDWLNLAQKTLEIYNEVYEK